jgi:hypothetical protein
MQDHQANIQCCIQIEELAVPLGMKRITRLSKMIRGLAEHDMVDTLGGPCQELEEAYYEGFQELIKLRARP